MSGAEPAAGEAGASLEPPGPRPLAPGSNDASPDEGLVEDLCLVDERAVEQLTEGLISHYLPDLQQSKQALQELTQNQAVLLDTLEQEISKFKECNSILDINTLFLEAKHYHSKLVNIRKEMLMLHEKTSKLKLSQTIMTWKGNIPTQPLCLELNLPIFCCLEHQTL
ncbi:biogenesis of lysosome-related organelles complex 1 subunit 6 isoform X2 [Alligator sinensis]|uniref:Biogenesis of lysosome-related organelles complex 1 subunit 6 isoform X2 n=1 Tax=Alligator sinensis TaxID=38654 RepID=A0A3Q0HBP7_ALLSI|nr:biogenesis of lysosome-related organelles complex 1 subunit 6 isoform X2 [Alligator sinensis]